MGDNNDKQCFNIVLLDIRLSINLKNIEYGKEIYKTNSHDR